MATMFSGGLRLAATLPRRIPMISISETRVSGDTTDWILIVFAFFGERYVRAQSELSCHVSGVCNLCNGGVKFVRDNDRNRNIRYEALQSESGKMLLRRSGRDPDDISSVVLVEKERSYIKSEAVLKIMEYINLPFPQLALFLNLVPLFIRDFAYDNLANNRYNIFGKSESCEIYADQ
uniref:Uncharacterized protein n=1 Tax=Chenopodium quinoa TaxID=63459 RepID=A0A803LN26_CHEQI